MKVTSLLLLLLVSFTVFAQRPIAFDDLINMRRIADAQISPDGTKIAYVVTAVNKDANRGKRSIWVVPASGGAPQQLISSDKNDDTPRWSSDGRNIAFLSTRDGAPQIYLAGADGSNPRRVTNAPEGVAEFVWSPDGRNFAFATDVYPECKDLKCVADRSEKEEKSKVKAVIADRLLFRHWTEFKRGKRSHIFVVSASGGDARDITPGDFDSPPFSLGDPTSFAFSPDGSEICFTRNTDKDEALSTNNDLFLVPVTGGEPRRITGPNPGNDTTPRYSPDGRFIAYRSQLRKGYESDRFRLMLFDRKAGTSRELTPNFSNWVEDLAWTPDSKYILIGSQDKGREVIHSVPVAGGEFRKLVGGSGQGSSNGFSISSDGRVIAFLRSSATMPAEVFRAGIDGSPAVQLTRHNQNLLAQLELNPAEEFEFAGGLKARVHGFIVKPPKFDKSKKYPMVLLVHGGPQSAWMDNWGYRWNPQMWAARGYVAVLINPHGSTGYGQAFTEQITGDWGGAVYEDLMKGVDHVISLGYVDPNRMGAAGGSYGGYMVNWINGHTNRFKAIVSHASIYNAESMYATEELWFQEWEWKGAPWDPNSVYRKWSPHMYAKDFKTPTLVVHGELDYRVPIGEGLQLFSMLQRRGIPSRLLYFPDEGHWVLKPQNSELWYATVLDWFDKWLK